MRRQSGEDRMLIYQEYVKAYSPENKKEAADRKGTGREWTPYRFCSQDWLLSTVVCRASRTRYDVGFFLAEEHFLFEEFAGVKAALAFLLADSFHKTGKMEIHFIGPREDEHPTLESGFLPGIPRAIRNYAASVGVVFKHRRKIEASEGKELYMKLARFSDDLLKILAPLDGVRAAFLSHRGVWSPLSLEYIGMYSGDPGKILVGGPSPERWLNFKRELLTLRNAVVGERIETLVRTADSSAEHSVRARWLHGVDVPTVGVTPTVGGSLRTLSGEFQFVAGVEIEFRSLIRDASAARFSGDSDLDGVPTNKPVLLVVAKDFDWTPSDYQAQVRKRAVGNVSIVQLFECLDEIDSEILARLGRCASTRRSLEGRGE